MYVFYVFYVFYECMILYNECLNWDNSVSQKPIMAGYQLLVFKMLYIYVMLICDTLLNYYLLTVYLCF